MLEGIVFEAHENFSYFLGGVVRPGTDNALRDVDRYNFPEKK